jgi:hypothetical protein
MRTDFTAHVPEYGNIYKYRWENLKPYTVYT